MSIRASNWAWSIPLPPAVKVVLLKLADIADDKGFCFPSVAALSMWCAQSERTVQRVMRKLVSGAYMSVEQRFRADGARTSNGYRLNLDMTPPPTKCHRGGGGRVTGAVTAVSGGRCQSCHRAGDSAVGVTTTEPSIEPPRQLLEHGRTGNAGVGSTDACRVDLSFPVGVSPAQQQALSKQLVGLSEEDAQRILDELAGRMNTTRVRDPVGYCRRLVELFRRGEFEPDLGRAVAKERQQNGHCGFAPAAQPDAKEEPIGRRTDERPTHIREALGRFRRPQNGGETRDASGRNGPQSSDGSSVPD